MFTRKCKITLSTLPESQSSMFWSVDPILISHSLVCVKLVILKFQELRLNFEIIAALITEKNILAIREHKGCIRSNTFADARVLNKINRLKWKLNGAFKLI